MFQFCDADAYKCRHRPTRLFILVLPPSPTPSPHLRCPSSVPPSPARPRPPISPNTVAPLARPTQPPPSPVLIPPLPPSPPPSYFIILGRNSKKSEVDVDFASLGGGTNISCHHAQIFYDFQRRRFALEVIGKNGCMVEGILHLPSTPPVELDSLDLLQIGDKQFYFLLPSRSIFETAQILPQLARPALPVPCGLSGPSDYEGGIDGDHLDGGDDDVDEEVEEEKEDGDENEEEEQGEELEEEDGEEMGEEGTRTGGDRWGGRGRAMGGDGSGRGGR